MTYSTFSLKVDLQEEGLLLTIDGDKFSAFLNNIPIVHVVFIFIDGGNWKYHGKVVSYISPQNGIALTNFISDTLMVIREYQHFIRCTIQLYHGTSSFLHQ
jgi:hypothetical protein